MFRIPIFYAWLEQQGISFFHKKTLYFLYCEIFRGVTKVLANKINFQLKNQIGKKKLVYNTILKEIKKTILYE